MVRAHACSRGESRKMAIPQAAAGAAEGGPQGLCCVHFRRDHAINCDLVAECTVSLASAKCSCTRGICGQACAGKSQGLAWILFALQGATEQDCPHVQSKGSKTGNPGSLFGACTCTGAVTCLTGWDLSLGALLFLDRGLLPPDLRFCRAIACAPSLPRPCR